MILKKFENVEKVDIESLIDNGVSEGKTIEYKQELPSNNDAGKKEFLADISAFANSSGGDLIYGVEESRDQNNKTTGIPSVVPGLIGINIDQELRRLESMIRDGIEPRISGIQIRAIDGFTNGPIILIRVSRSWSAPHMVTFKGSSRFFCRTNAGKVPLDVGEIRAAFLQSETVPERMRKFREERIAAILANETPYPLFPNGRIVVHYLPVGSFDRPQYLDVGGLKRKFFELPSIYGSGSDHRLNIDGLLTFTRSSGKECIGYTQLFRTGVIESVDSGLLQPEDNGSRHNSDNCLRRSTH